MVAAELPGSDEERAEAALIAAAGKILRDGHREVPADFVAEMFAHAVPEDLLRYDPRQLAELAADAWSLLAVRKPGVPNIRLERWCRAESESGGATSRCSRSSTTTCRSWSTRCWRSWPNAASTFASSCIPF